MDAQPIVVAIATTASLRRQRWQYAHGVDIYVEVEGEVELRVQGEVNFEARARGMPNARQPRMTRRGSPIADPRHMRGLGRYERTRMRRTLGGALCRYGRNRILNTRVSEDELPALLLPARKYLHEASAAGFDRDGRFSASGIPVHRAPSSE